MNSRSFMATLELMAGKCHRGRNGYEPCQPGNSLFCKPCIEEAIENQVDNQRLLDLMGQFVKFKARNIGVAEWKEGLLVDVRINATSESFVDIRLQNGAVRKVSLREFMVQRAEAYQSTKG